MAKAEVEKQTAIESVTLVLTLEEAETIRTILGDRTAMDSVSDDLNPDVEFGIFEALAEAGIESVHGAIAP